MIAIITAYFIWFGRAHEMIAQERLYHKVSTVA